MSAIMKSLCFSFLILASFATFFSVADAWRFNVGGNGAWVTNPQENYNTWAERNRFQVNDSLYFKYAKGSDSVQQVMKADFDGCNVRNPIKNFDNGESVITLDRSGAFYFISGNQEHCQKGQKLIVVVLASPATPSPMTPQSPSPVSSPSPDQSAAPSDQSTPLAPSPSETTPTADNITAPALSPRTNSASGLAVTSVMSTLLSATFTFLMFA
ncbi:unnamed protein product [Arabidopsis thaliana]|uniref:(thale cress) hypothetical protein n=1 Tax=Arabidopsis thaliana TaxID=3702 RepID=A0A7G2FFX4_ARATH|nr:unnamed protein product [Arabidopsis thaliana]